LLIRTLDPDRYSDKKAAIRIHINAYGSKTLLKKGYGTNLSGSWINDWNGELLSPVLCLEGDQLGGLDRPPLLLASTHHHVGHRLVHHSNNSGARLRTKLVLAAGLVSGLSLS
jgi:hypothetical protein